MAREFRTELIIDGNAVTRVARFFVRETAGRPLEAEIELVLAAGAELIDLVAKPAALSFGAADEEPRMIVGVVEAASVVGTPDLGLGLPGTRFVVRVVSGLALLGQSVSSQIFQEKTVQEVVTKVLADHGMTDVAWRLTASYAPREYVVQYQESALDFVSRLLEHEGIYVFVETEDGREKLIFADDSTTAAPIDGDAALPVRRRTGLGETGDAIYTLSEKRRVRSGKFTLRDFDFKRPKLDLTASSEAPERSALEVYDYPGGYVEPAEGARLARVRLEEAQVERETFTVEGVCARVTAGRTIDLTDAGDLDGTYFVFEVTHEYVHAASASGGPRAAMHARMIPVAVPFRPRRVTPLPRIQGPQTATVVAPASSPPESIHTDEHGRCKVKFRWDRAGIEDDKASCWMRVQQLQTSGSMMLPRIGWEVIVEFLEGDPDRPLVTGRLYNGVYMPPYALPEGKTRTAIKTASTPGGGGSNEIRFEDKAGSEEVMIHAQHDMTVVAANNAKRTIGSNATTNVTNNASLEVGADHTAKITKGSSTTIGADQTVSVGGNRKVAVNAVSALTVHGSATTSVGGKQFEMDGNPLEAMLALAAAAAASFAAQLADNAVGAVQAHVDGAVSQVMGPIQGLQDQVAGVQGAMQAVANGDLSGVAGMVAGASGLPGASQLAASMAAPPAGGGESASRAAPGGGPEAAGGGGEGDGGAGAPTTPQGASNALAAMASTASRQAIQAGVAAGASALAGALGLDAGGGGGESMGNAAGPAGDVEGIAQTDREKGPGHSTSLIGGTHDETVGTLKVVASIQDIDTNVSGDTTIDIGAATIQLAIGNYAETVGGAKTESSLGLVVLSKGGESETVSGSKTTMVGGAIVDKLKGSHIVTAGGPATFIGAFHKIEASGAIVLKCGESEVVIDGGGITVTSPLVTFLAPKIVLSKKVSEV